MNNAISVPRDLLERSLRSIQHNVGFTDTINDLIALLSAPVVDGELEAIAWQDAENPQYTTGEKRQMHGWATDGYPIVPLCSLPKAQAIIAQQAAMIALYERALLVSWPEGAKGEAFNLWSEARILGSKGDE